MFWFFIWQIVGIIIHSLIWAYGTDCKAGNFDGDGAVANAIFLEIVNPVHIYKFNQVNWFGAIVVATFYGLICPIATIGYWFYKLCTVGRK